MSELEDLPSWAGRSTGTGPAPDESKTAAPAARGQASTLNLSNQQIPLQMQVQQPPRRRPMTVALLVLMGLLALLAMGAGGYFLASSQDSTGTEAEVAGESSGGDGAGQMASQGLDEEASSDDVAAEAGADDDENGETVAAENEADAEADSDADTVTVDVDEAAEQDAAADEDNPENDTEDATDETADASEPSDERQAIFKAGKLYLQGAVPSEEIGQAIEEKAAAVVGPDNVINEYVIDPESVIVPGAGAPLYVEDVVLFEFNSIEVARPFLPILDLGTLLLRQNPQATVTVVTRTDAVGSEAVNLDVSTKRAQAVINYWLGQGVNPDQIKAEPLGEQGASEDDDEQTAALNRRAEFIIAGLLD